MNKKFVWFIAFVALTVSTVFGMGWLRPDKTYYPTITNTTPAVVVTNTVPPAETNAPPTSGPRLLSVVADGEFYIKWKVEGISHWKNTTAGGVNAEIIVNGVSVENIREGYTRQHLKNAYGTGEHSVRGIRKGDTVEIYLRKKGGRERTTSVPFVWPWKGTSP